MTARIAGILCVGLVLSISGLSAEDWSQWRGPGRQAIWNEQGIVDSLPDSLRRTWSTEIRSGYSGPAVADGRIFITDWLEDPESRTLDGTERALALDEQSGEILWTHEWQTSYRMLSISYAVGPRATPTVDGDRVYVVGGTGRLFCFDVETGDVLWEKDYVSDYDTSVPVWGIVSGPLVDGDRLITVVGGEPDAGVVAGCFHPLQTFPSRDPEPWRFEDVACGIEGADPLSATLELLASDLGASVVRLEGVDRGLYHAAAVFSSNYTVAVAAAAQHAWTLAGLPVEQAQSALSPLQLAAARNVD